MGDTKVEVNGGSGFGCFTLVLGIILLWALIFGVNYDGKHYGLSCGADGVTIQKGD